MFQIIEDNEPQEPVNPAFVGTGTVRPVGLTRTGTATHFMQADQLTTLCGVVTMRDTDDDDWVSCERCMAAARKADRMNRERRILRFLALILVFVGTVGTVAALRGLMGDAEGSAAFPASVVIGIVVIVANRPRRV